MVPVPLKLVPVPIGSKGLVPIPVKVVPVPLLLAAMFLHIFASLSFVFVYRLFRDPKKRLMGVQIRMRLSEKRTVPRRLEASPRGYSFSMIICLTTKSEEFVFDYVRVKTTT